MSKHKRLAAWMRENHGNLVRAVVHPCYEIATSEIVARLIISRISISSHEFTSDEIELIATISLRAIATKIAPEAVSLQNIVALDVAREFRRELRLRPMFTKPTGIPHTTHQRCNPDGEPLH
jgi:hypothetical protein